MAVVFHYFCSLYYLCNRCCIKSDIVSAALLFAVFSRVASGGYWVDVGESQTRDGLLYLHNSGLISVPLATWPLSSDKIKNALIGIDNSVLTFTQKSVVSRIKQRVVVKQENYYEENISVFVGNSARLFSGFSKVDRDDGELSYSISSSNIRYVARLKANLTETKTIDGSFFVGKTPVFDVGVGVIDRWWGPGQYTNLVLSNNARPIPAFFVRSSGAGENGPYIFSWVKNWSFEMFLGQLESDRAIPSARLTGIRFTFFPIVGLELGMSRVMQWGGEGRDNGLSTFMDSLTSRGENDERSAGNQLGGFDFHYRLDWLRWNTSLYGQIIGEDEANFLPSKYMSQLGLNVLMDIGQKGAYAKWFVEYTNTTAGAFGAEHYNTAYEHSTYRSGYRYYGRAIGAVFDNDSEVTALGANFYLENSMNLGAALINMRLNNDNSGVNSLVESSMNLQMIELNVKFPLLSGYVSGSISILSDELPDAVIEVNPNTVVLGWSSGI